VEDTQRNLKITVEHHNIREEGVEWPLPLGVMPNQMGINLCSVEGMTWSRLPDRQLVSLTIHFIPALDSV
jgi:hypothetical protein